MLGGRVFPGRGFAAAMGGVWAVGCAGILQRGAG